MEEYNGLSEEAKDKVSNSDKLQASKDKVNSSNNSSSSNSNSSNSSKPSGENSNNGSSSKPTKPSGGGSSSSGGGTSSKPTKPTEPSKPKNFAMSKSEIISYANSICESKGLIYAADATKDNAGWYSPEEISKNDSASEIKEAIKQNINFVYKGTINAYKIYVEQTGDTMKVYFLYGTLGGPDEY